MYGIYKEIIRRLSWMRNLFSGGSLLSLSLSVWTHLQHGVGLQQAVFDCLHLLASRTGDGIVLQDLLGRLCLPGAALPGDEDALVLPLRPQGSV